jgi:phage shock protein E
MINTIKKIFGVGPKVNFSELIAKGAVVVDVRSRKEYAFGHRKGSVNIPLPELKQNFNKLPKDKTIITCCASGMRSATAKNILLSGGFRDVYNGGSWSNL